MNLPYSEGSVFLVPLQSGGYARGVVARAGKKGKVLLGYFFGPRVVSVDGVAVVDLLPGNSILKVRFGDLGLIKGDWPILGVVPNWNRDAWPMPDFFRLDEISKRAWRTKYSDEDPNRIECEYPTQFDAKLPRDSLFGYGAIEITLSKMLG